MSAAMSISIRPYEEADISRLYEAARESTAVIYPWLKWCHPDYSLDEARAWVLGRAEAFKSRRELEFAVVDPDREGRFLGGVGLNAIRLTTANLGYWVRTSERGRGVTPTAVRLLLEWAREHTTLTRVECLVAVGNSASLRVAEKVGGLRERIDHGRLLLHGVQHDAVVFSFNLVEEPE
jgi:RimJ/RimL family protein N-acetyltransferase